MLTVCVCMLSTVSAEEVSLNTKGRDKDYVNVILGRSQKIVDGLNLKSKQEDVRNVIANRYFKLNDIYESRDKKISDAKSNLSGKEKSLAIDCAKKECDASLYRSHFDYTTKLSMFLNNDQVSKVKDLMTYNLVSVTYGAYLEMIPSLKDNEKKQIKLWLEEAREFAIDAGSSKGKHAAFGKFKGRINNYLSACGYNLDKERKAWYERIKATKKN